MVQLPYLALYVIYLKIHLYNLAFAGFPLPQIHITIYCDSAALPFTYPLIQKIFVEPSCEYNSEENKRQNCHPVKAMTHITH